MMLRNCRFKDQTCYHCGKVGHIAKVCRSKLQGKPKQTPKTPPPNAQVHTVEYSETDEYEDLLSLKIHNVSNPGRNAIWVDLKLGRWETAEDGTGHRLGCVYYHT